MYKKHHSLFFLREQNVDWVLAGNQWTQAITDKQAQRTNAKKQQSRPNLSIQMPERRRETLSQAGLNPHQTRAVQHNYG